MKVNLKDLKLDDLYELKERCKDEESKYTVIAAINIRKNVLKKQARASVIGEPMYSGSEQQEPNEYFPVELNLDEAD